MTMETPDEIRRDLPSDLGRSESEQLVALGMRLRDQLPTPAPSFRGDLRRKLAEADDRRFNLIAPRLARVLAACYVVVGLLLLAVSAAGLAGAGPFATG